MVEAPSVVLDASALIAFACNEPGTPRVERALPLASINAYNAAETIAVLCRADTPRGAALAISRLGLNVISCDWEIARSAAEIQALTRKAGLSLSECICLATARALGIPALTANPACENLNVGIAVEILR